MTRSRQRVYAFGRGLCLAFATAVLFVAGNPIPGAGNARLATAQVARPEGAEDYSQNVFLPPDRPTLRKLSQSRLLIEEGRYGEAVRFLGDILEEPEDYLFSPKGSSPVFRSLKSEAERLIGRLPRRGRDLYELQYGAQAQRMLTDALASGDVARLAEVSRRFFHARSGYQATFLLGLHHFDHGRPLAGAMVLQRLREVDPPVEELEPGLSLSLASCWLQAGMPERARESLASLRQRDPALRVTVAGREVPLFADDSEAIDWLAGLIGAWSAPEREIPDDWLMFRGNSSRNASTNGGSPLLNMRWRVLATDDPLTESILTQYRNIFSERGLPAVPILHPLAVGDVVLMRTLRNLLAVDFATGKRLWEVPFEEPVELASAENVQQLQAALALGAGQRMWGDLTYGTLSSDGRHVFSVEDLGLESGDDSSAVQRINVQGMGIQGRVVIRIRNPRAVINGTSLCNRLTAHDIRTGKLTWELGGTDGPRALRQAETFFLGPPLPLMGRLYVLAEIKGEVRLLALDSATGDLCWTQQLSLIERGVLETPQRRWTGVSPSYADGVLVCPTSTGAVVGVELATRSLLWGYCYHQDQNNAYNNGLPFVLVGPSADRWIDGAVAIRDGRVFVTPQDSNRLYCLNLIDGELLWKSQRKNDLYVACVDREKVVLVGRDAVRALRLEDGEPAWGGRVVSLPEGSTPSGRGFLSGDQYFLPLGSAEVAAIDLAAGRIDNISKSRNGTIPGNLVCHKGIIVSQGIQGVDAYFQLDLASAEVGRRLKVNPNDAWALSLRGEILLNADRRSEAIASFRHAYDLTPDPRTRELLRDTLLDGLRSEFAAYRGRGEEIEPLLDDLSQRAVFLRLMASGLHGEGQWAEAFENYSKLVDLEPNRQPLDQVDDGLVVRRDRWIQGQLAELRKEAKGETAEKIDQIVSARLKTALAADSIDPLRRFLDYFGRLPAADAAHDEMIRRLKSEGQRLEVELASPPAEKPADRDAAKSDVVWPTGNVEVATAPTKNLAGLDNHYFPVELRGSPGPFFRDLTIKFDYKPREIVAFDGSGRKKWKVSLVNIDQNNLHLNYSTMYARAVGHLLLVALGWNVYAIDTLGSSPDGAPRLLWVQDLSNPNVAAANLPGLRQAPIPPAILPPQLQIQLANFQNQPNLLGPADNNYVCLRRFQSVMAVDPRNGETLWVRQDMPAVCDVFGDDRHLFVLTTDEEDARLLRVGDGELLGTRKLPRHVIQRRMPNGQMQTMYSTLQDTCLAAFGRKLLLWWPEGNQRELTLIDPLEGRDEWPRRKFAANAQTSVADDETVGVMEPDGRFVLISLPDGRTLADVKLDSEPDLLNITLFKSGEQFFLLTNYQSGNIPPIQPMPNQRHHSINPINQGRLYAFDSQGKLLWPGPVKVEKQLLLSDQPAALPVVIFASQHYERKPNGQGQWKPRVLCFDKRSGRRVYKGEFDNHMGIFNVACDIEKKTVALTMQKETVTLTYTDNPIPPPSAADADPTESPPGSKIAHALWNSIRKTIVPINPFGDED